MNKKRIVSYILAISLLSGNFSTAFAADNNFTSCYANKQEVESDGSELGKEMVNGVSENDILNGIDETNGKDKSISVNEVTTENDVISDNGTSIENESISDNKISTENVSDNDIFNENPETLSSVIMNAGSEPYACNLEVTKQEYGTISLCWEIENKPIGSTTYRYANVYRAYDENAEYVLVGKNIKCYFDDNYYRYTDTDVRSEGTENEIYFYKVCILNEDGTEGEFTNVAANTDMYYGSGTNEDYIGAYIGDAEGNKLNQLIISEGQTLELTIVLVKKDGTTEIVTSDDITEGNWYLYDQYYTTEEFMVYPRLEQIEDSLLGFYPVKWEIVKDYYGDDYPESINYRVYVNAKEGSAKEEPYYMTLQAEGLAMTELRTGRWFWQIPVYVKEKQEGEEFTDYNGVNGNIFSLEGLYKALREDMVNRKEKAVYYVKENVYEEFYANDFDAVFDFDRERDDMKPYEGDYLKWQNSSPTQIESIWTGWICIPSSFNNENWWSIICEQPFLTTREQEDQVDAKIKEIVWTEGGELYSYHNAGDYEIIKACYDYVRKHVSYIGTPTPSYHSCWSALIRGKGTCQAYSLLYGRLLREFGIANKLIMGTDKNAHTYNIVEIDDIWYYSDSTLSTFGLYGEKNFKRTTYQEMFFDEEFQINYIQKISDTDYVPDSVYLYGDGIKIDGCSSLQAAVSTMREHAAQNPEVEYSIKLASDAVLTGTEFSDLTGILSCKVDLGGNKLVINTDNLIQIDELKNGKLELGKEVNLRLFARETAEDNLVLNNLTINSASNTAGSVTIGRIETEQEINDGQKGVVLDKVTINDACCVNLYGNISFDDAAIITENLTLDSKDNGSYQRVGGSITSKEVEILAGNWKLGEISLTNLMNAGMVEIQNLKKVLNIENRSEAGMILNQILQTSSGKVWLEPESVLICNKNAVIYNIVIGGKEPTESGKVYVYKAPEAKLSLEGNVSRSNENTKLYFGVLEDESIKEPDSLESIKDREFAAGECLFTTQMKSFPISFIMLKQPAENEGNIVAYQQGQEVLAGKENLILWEKDESGKKTELGRFVRWSDVLTYLKSVPEIAKDYIVEIPENVELKESLTMPEKVNSITFISGAEDESNIQLTYLGDIKLLSETTFKNIDLKAEKYNTKIKGYEEYFSAVNLNGKTLQIINGTADFVSVKGNKNAKLVLDNTTIVIKKALTSLEVMELNNSELFAEQVTVTNVLKIQSSEINSNGKVSLKDIVSLDDKNIITYGGNTSKNILSITGNISSNDRKNTDVIINRTENDENITKTVTIRKNAITLKVASLEKESESGYKTGILLCNAPKAGASWFVVGSEWEQEDPESRTITYAAYKKGNAVYCGEAESIVCLYSSQSEQLNEYVYEGGFSSVQDALSEIDKLDLKTNYYRIELRDVQKDVVTFSNKNLTFPSKASGIILTVGDNLSEGVIYLKDKVSLKCNVVFEDIIFSPAKNIKFELGNFRMALVRCSSYDAQDGNQFSVNEIGERVVRAASVNGSGTAKNSELILSDTVLMVAGAVKNLGNLVYTGEQAEHVSSAGVRYGSIPLYSKLEADGAVTIGNIELETEGTLIGLATIKRSKDRNVTGITSQITIAKDVISGKGNILYLDLREKQGKSYVNLELSGKDTEEILRTGFSLAKGNNVTYPKIQAAQLAGKNLVKKNGNLVYYENDYGVELRYEENGREIMVPCVSFADAVTEINNRKEKKSYVITLLPANADISSSMPMTLTMPNKKYINSLVIQADPETASVQLYYLNKISFTSNTTIKDVSFVQMMKNGSAYLNVDEVKRGYPAAVTVNTGGFDLQIEGEVTFNTPVLIKGGNKGTLTLTSDGTINTQTNEFGEVNSEAENIVYGMITDFKTINMNGCNLELIEYETAYGSKKYKSVNMKVAQWNLSDGDVMIKDRNGKAVVKITNLWMENGNIEVGGKLNLTNVEIEGTSDTIIQVDKDFNITGTLVSNNDNANLHTRLKGTGKAPYLNISGMVVRGEDINPIYVGVYPEMNSLNPEKAVTLMGAPKVTGQLLTAKKASALDFRPIDDNYTAGKGEYSQDNPTGYVVVKSGSNIYVYEGSTYVQR